MVYKMVWPLYLNNEGYFSIKMLQSIILKAFKQTITSYNDRKNIPELSITTHSFSGKKQKIFPYDSPANVSAVKATCFMPLQPFITSEGSNGKVPSGMLYRQSRQI
jgi:hypothetical protein